MSSYLTVDPYIPLALWVPLAAAALGLLGVYAWAGRGRMTPRRWATSVALLALGIAVPMAILLNPTWLQRVPPPAGKPLVTILVDRSASMATRDADRLARYQAAAEYARQVEERLGDRYEIRLRTFAQESSPAGIGQLPSLRADGPATDLAGTIGDALEVDRPQGQSLLLLSDGGHNAAGGMSALRQSTAQARAMTAPIYTRTFGSQTGVRDLEVSLGLPEELAFTAQQVPVIVSLRARGALSGTARVSVLLDGRTLESRDVPLEPDSQVETVFQVTQQRSGLYRYEVRAEPRPDEVTTVNNAATLVLRVVDEPVGVLLLEGKPYWDTKFLVRTLAADPSIELTSVVQVAEGRLLERKITRPAPQPAGGAGKVAAASAGEKPAGPAETWSIRKDAGEILGGANGLGRYQIIVLGRNAELFLSDDVLARLKKWLSQQEGALVCFRGPPASQIGQRLGELMPVRWTPVRESRFRMEWSPTGRDLRWLPGSGEGDSLSAMPSLAEVARPERPTPLAVVLATAAGDGNTPAIVYQPVGTGRVVVVEGAGMWRWAFLPPQHQDRDACYGQLWRSLIRWLVSNVGLLPSQQFALRTDKVTFGTEESPTATLLVREGIAAAQVPQVELTGDGLGRAPTFTPLPSGAAPGQYRVAFGRLPEGRYRARLLGAAGAAEAAFDVRGNLRERLDVAAQPALMQWIAAQSGGAAITDADPARLAERFDRHLAASRPERVVRTTAWDRWWVLAGVLVLWGGAWGLRRWSGLV